MAQAMENTINAASIELWKDHHRDSIEAENYITYQLNTTFCLYVPAIHLGYRRIDSFGDGARDRLLARTR